MIKLHRVFDLWFDTPKITPARKLSFADDLRNRLATNNSSGAFDLILPQLDTALTAAGGATSSETVAPAVRKAAGDRIAAVSAVDGNQDAALDIVLMKAVFTAGLIDAVDRIDSNVRKVIPVTSSHHHP